MEIIKNDHNSDWDAAVWREGRELHESSIVSAWAWLVGLACLVDLVQWSDQLAIAVVDCFTQTTKSARECVTHTPQTHSDAQCATLEGQLTAHLKSNNWFPGKFGSRRPQVSRPRERERVKG